MRIAGEEIKGSNEDFLVLPRNPKPIIIRGRAVQDFDKFERLRPLPEPPGVLTAQGFKPDPKDKGYQQQMANHAIARLAFIATHTLYEIEWDTVNLDDPTTWTNWVDELVKAGFSSVEQTHILNFVMEVNCLDEKKMAKARADFLRGLEQDQNS